MKNANIDTDQILRADDLVWYALAEFSLSQFISGYEGKDELAAKLLFQAAQELGIPPEYIEEIQKSLESSVKGALVDIKHGRPELPGRIRVFYQNRMKNQEMKGGWGYFLIERTGDSSADTPGDPPHFIDLYLYQDEE
jgi:hypothetical protein